MFSAASIVWDREYGFLREMMVAPVRRSSIVIGKCLGGATVAGTQGVIVLCLAGAVGVPYNPVMIVELLVLQLLLAFAITAFGVMIAIRIKQMQSFMGVTQMVMTPMMFISGALFPVAALPVWLTVLNRIDPLTYAVDSDANASCSSTWISRRRLDRRSIRGSHGGAGACRRCSRPRSWSCSDWRCSVSRSGSSARPIRNRSSAGAADDHHNSFTSGRGGTGRLPSHGIDIPLGGRGRDRRLV